MQDATSPDSSSYQQLLTDAQRHLRAGHLQEARDLAGQVLQQRPDDLRATYILGLVADQQEQFAEAVTYYQKTIALKSDAAEVHNLLGNALQRLRQFAEAIPCYQRAIALQPNFPAAYNNLGAAHQELGQYPSAVAAYQQALVLKPDYADVYYNLGNAHRNHGNLEAAIALYRQTLAIQPHYPKAHNNLGLTLYDQLQPDAAIQEYHKALELQPDYADVHQNLALALLLKGDLVEGFREYEWRWVATGPDNHPLPDFPQPLWDGSDLHGKTILIHAEQGFGDTLQFIRYIPLVVAKGGRIVFECPPVLVRLLTSVPGIAQIVTHGDPRPPFDTHLPLLSLPRLFGTTLETIPPTVPYLTPPSSPSFRLSPASFHVGLVWAGSPTNRNDRHRSCSLETLRPLLQESGVRFHSLQKGGRVAELAPLVEQGLIEDWDSRLQDFADTAALIQQLDLVITVDTSVAHLAGALGKPTWVLLSIPHDWRWLLHRSDSPWYPTVRLFRQKTPGDWSSVITDAIAALRSLPKSTPSFPPPLPPTPIGIGWEIGANTGWRIYGLNLALQLLRRSHTLPVPLVPLPNPGALNPLHRALLQPLMAHQQQLAQMLEQNPDKQAGCNFLVLRGMGNNGVMIPTVRRLVGQRNVGVIFSEDTRWERKGLVIAQSQDFMIAGSTWNTEVLRSYGLNAQTVLQGIDPTLFHPAPRAGWLNRGDRFVIFSGGKLEYRKGQDIVVAAFRAFQSRHPEALLLTAWHNPWPQTLVEIVRSGHVTGLPKSSPTGELQIKPWLVENGVPEQAVLDLGPISSAQAAQIVREADVAVFPNRAEGGTNLVAMECLACGVPTLLAANTGHLDLIREDHCYPLRSQGRVAPTEQFRGTEGWGESAVEEVVETLEAVYQDRQTAQQRGQAAAQFMQDWTWDRQVERLLKTLQL